MRRYALPIADDPSWPEHPRYRPDAAPMLRAASRATEHTQPSATGLNQAFQCIAPLFNTTLCPQQSIRLLYIAARVQKEERAYDSAIKKIDRALSISDKERLIPEKIELLAFKGELERCVSRFHSAASNLRESLGLLESVEKRTGTNAIGQRFELLWQLATYTFAQGDFEGASQHVEEALSLHPLVRHLTFEAASVLWIKAHLERTRGNLYSALGIAINVAREFETNPLASVLTCDRIERFVAEIALDIAEGYADGPTAINRDPTLQLAEKHLRRAAKLADDSHDLSGSAQITLSRIRESRLRGKNTDRIRKIERVLATAKRIGDVALRAQALIVLGDELAYQGETESALNRYRETLDVLARSEVAAYCVRPRRMLLRYSERGTFGI